MKELVLIQTKMNAPKKHSDGKNRFQFRNVEDILLALKPFLAECECVINLTDELVVTPVGNYIKATAKLINRDGEVFEATGFAKEEDGKNMNASQYTGSASSYARKYALNGLLALDDNEDPDARIYEAERRELESADTLPADITKAIDACQTAAELKQYINTKKAWHKNPLFQSYAKARRQSLQPVDPQLPLDKAIVDELYSAATLDELTLVSQKYPAWKNNQAFMGAIKFRTNQLLNN